jgi:hypothetical protein
MNRHSDIVAHIEAALEGKAIVCRVEDVSFHADSRGGFWGQAEPLAPGPVAFATVRIAIQIAEPIPQTPTFGEVAEMVEKLPEYFANPEKFE